MCVVFCMIKGNRITEPSMDPELEQGGYRYECPRALVTFNIGILIQTQTRRRNRQWNANDRSGKCMLAK